jgi:hypothetical protein
MKKLIFTLLACATTALAVKAQTMAIKNNTACTLYYTLIAAPPTCPTSYSASNVFSIPPFSNAVYNMSTFTSWVGTPPPTGSTWIAVKLIDELYNPSCSPVGIVLGDCYSLPTSGTLTPNPVCNACTVVNARWINYGGPDKALDINP